MWSLFRRLLLWWDGSVRFGTPDFVFKSGPSRLTFRSAAAPLVFESGGTRLVFRSDHR